MRRQKFLICLLTLVPTHRQIHKTAVNLKKKIRAIGCKIVISQGMRRAEIPVYPYTGCSDFRYADLVNCADSLNHVTLDKVLERQQRKPSVFLQSHNRLITRRPEMQRGLGNMEIPRRTNNVVIR